MATTDVWLIVVTGRPAAGKTTLALWLGKELGFPVISKDTIKELLFDQLGWRDREWSKTVGRTSVELMLFFAKSQLEAGKSVILDNAFHPDLASSKFQELEKAFHPKILQIICDAENEILYSRFKERAESGKRHPGHVDFQSLGELKRTLSERMPLKLKLSGAMIQVDTSDLRALDYDGLRKQIASFMED